MFSERGQSAAGWAIVISGPVVIVLCVVIFITRSKFPKVGGPMEKDVEYSVDYQQDIPLNNCAGSSPIEFEREVAHGGEHVIIVDATGITEIDIRFIKQKIEAKYGINEKETFHSSTKLFFVASAGESVVYHVTWKYLWRKGDGIVKYANGEEKPYEFEVRMELIPSVDVETVGCSP